jgi:hypothetical protein
MAMQFVNDETVNANVFLTFNGDLGGSVGVAWLGSVCESDARYRSSVSQWFMSSLTTAEVFTV